MSNTIPWTEAWYVNGDDAWAITGKESHVLRIRKSEKSIEYVCTANNREKVYRMYSQIFVYNEKVYLLPDESNYIEIYNTAYKTWKSICVIENDDNNRRRIRSVSYWKIDKYLWFFSAALGRIYCLDLDDDKIITSNTIIITDNPKEVLWDYSIEKKGDEIFVLERTMGYMYKIYLSRGEVEKKKIEIDSDILAAFSYDGVNFWITGQKCKLYVWNYSKGIIDIIDLPSRLLFETDLAEGSYWPNYIFCWCAEGNVWLVPARTDGFLCINIQNKQIHEMNIEKDLLLDSSWTNSELMIRFKQNYTVEERYLGLYSFGTNLMIEIDAKSGEWKYLDMKLKNKLFLGNEKIIMEDKVVGLDLFIEKIIHRD